MVLPHESSQLPRPCGLPFAKLLVSVEDDRQSLSTIGWRLLEDSDGGQWGGQLKE
jgi:hypothetical protein